jgi:hypothetical protein
VLRAFLAPRLTRPLFWIAWTFSFVMAVLPHPPRIPGEPDDKIKHILAFLTLALLGAFAFPKLKPWKLLLWLSLFGAVIEVIQMVPMLHRDADVIDWLADTFAAAAVIGPLAWWRARSA